tara:strand:+ start:331 stop:924 length:594 start_codon:yes stop_codon:yes gene_type:complete
MIINHNILFIHIPRTGGRFLSYLFRNSGHFCYNDCFVKEYDGVEVAHLNSLQTNNYYPLSTMFKKFTIVRDPIDKFISALQTGLLINDFLVQKMFENESNFFNIVNNLRKNKMQNWFEPQVNFIEYNTKIWKFEKGLDKKFFNWVDNNFNLTLNSPDSKTINKYKHVETNKLNIDLNNKQKKYIENYYYQDYKMLNY